METKTSLRRTRTAALDRASELSARLKHAEWALTGAESALDNLGYEPVDIQHPVFDRLERDWRLTEAQSAKIAARDAELAEHLATEKAAAREEGRREALALVIEALEIPGYVPGSLRAFLTGADSDPIARFHADLTTAVEVRRDIAAATERGKVEKKIADLSAKKKPLVGVDLATGGLIGVGNSRIEPSGNANPPFIFDRHLGLQVVDHDVATAGEKLTDPESLASFEADARRQA